MRLIDADNLIEFFTNLEKAGARFMVFADAKRFVNEQPTAYDVDKVMQRIDNEVPGLANLQIYKIDEIVKAGMKEN